MIDSEIGEEIRNAVQGVRVNCAARGCPCAATQSYHGLKPGRPPRESVGTPYCPAHYWQVTDATRRARRRATR